MVGSYGAPRLALGSCRDEVFDDRRDLCWLVDLHIVAGTIDTVETRLGEQLVELLRHPSVEIGVFVTERDSNRLLECS